MLSSLCNPGAGLLVAMTAALKDDAFCTAMYSTDDQLNCGWSTSTIIRMSIT